MLVLLSALTAQASECVNDSQCASGVCVNYPVSAPPSCLPPPFDWICDGGGETLIAGECTDDLGQLFNRMTESCMRPIGGSQQTGTTITNDPSCANTASRDWFEIDLNNGTTGYMNRWSELCLTQTGSGYTQEYCNLDHPSQQFQLTAGTGAFFRMFHNSSSTTCVRSHPNLDDPFRSSTCNQHNTQSRHWRLQ